MVKAPEISTQITGELAGRQLMTCTSKEHAACIIPILLMSTSRNAIAEALTIVASDAFVKPHSIAAQQGILLKFFL